MTWGSYALTGTFDGTTFTVTDAIPAALYDTMAEPEEEPLAAACDDPTTTDTAKATPEDMDATLGRGLRAADVRLRVAHAATRSTSPSPRTPRAPRPSCARRGAGCSA